jgi:alpha-tubulin suppressor-like RCC1 family protein
MAESLLLAFVRHDYCDHVFKYLAPPDAGRLECAFTSDLVFVEAGAVEGDQLLRSVARRRHAEAVKAGAKMPVPLGERREGRVTWAMELRWIYMAMARLRVGGAKKMASAGGTHSLVTSGTVGGGIWCFGKRHGGEGIERVPRQVEALSRMAVTHVAAGYLHSAVLTREGSVFTWGDGYLGQLGHGNEDNQLLPKRLEELTDVTYIAVGAHHNLAVSGEAVHAWGCNADEQLGLGSGSHHDESCFSPTIVNGLSEVVAVAAGDNHSFVVSKDGTIKACGQNAVGQLGLGDTTQRDTFTAVPVLCGVVDMDAGASHTIAVTAEGVYTWGMGRGTGQGNTMTERAHGQCLVPTKVTGGGIEDSMVVQVAAGDYHSLALTALGELYSWGDGAKGQLGHGKHDFFTVQAASDCAPRIVRGIGAVVSMVGGDQHSLVTTVEGRVLSFGSNGEYRYEDSDGEDMDEPVFVVDGRLGLGAGVREAMSPMAIDGILLGEEAKAKGMEGNE